MIKVNNDTEAGLLRNVEVLLGRVEEMMSIHRVPVDDRSKEVWISEMYTEIDKTLVAYLKLKKSRI